MTYLDKAREKEYHAEYGRNLRAKLRAKGLCTLCGRTPVPGKNWCERCGFRCSVNNKELSAEEKQKAWQLYKNFDGRCQCCGTRNPGKRRFCLDHKDGKVRGIICSKCNVALGYLRDDPQIALRAAAYLQEKGALPSQPTS